MLIAILILTIFNTGMIMVLGLGGFSATQDTIRKAEKAINYNTDKDTETALTALFNQDSLKQKAEMSGEVEIP